MKKSTALRSLGIFLVLLGVFLAMLINITLIIASVEGFYSFTDELIMRPAKLSGVNCPLVIGKGQSTDVTITVKNPTEYKMTTTLITRIINHNGDIEKRTPVIIEPGEKQVIVQTLTPRHVIYDRMILADFFLIGTLGMPNTLRICPVTILPWDINAQLGLYLLVGLILLFIGIGLFLWFRYQTEKTSRQPLTKPGVIVLVLVSLVGVASNALGHWMIAVGAIFITLLLFILLGAYVMHDA